MGQPCHLFRANQIDDFARLKAFALQQGHGADMVRINQRLYIGGSSGKYRIPDLYFPQSGTILDGITVTGAITAKLTQSGDNTWAGDVLLWLGPASIMARLPRIVLRGIPHHV